MKHFSFVLLVCTMMTTIVTSTAFAILPIDVAAPISSRPLMPKVPEVGVNGIYKFTQNTEVIPAAVLLNGEVENNIGGVSLDVYKDESVAIEFLGDGQVLMTLRLADEELGKVPEQLILSREEFDALKLQITSTGNVADLMKDYTGYFDTDVAGPRNSRARQHNMRQETSRRSGFRRDSSGRIAGGGGNCVRVVKSLTGFSGTAGNGVGMASALQRIGYRPVSFSSKQRGTVCSWSGGFHGKGHVAYFDGSCFQPTYGGNCGSPGKNYRMIKCVHKG